MKVRAKMRCNAVKPMPLGNNPGAAEQQVEVVLHPVYEDKGVNKEWSRWTPSGELRLTITNPSAYEQFVQGVVYFVDIERVTPEA